MYKLEPNEYSQLDYFRNLQRYNPTERLLRYKRNVIGLGGFVLFFIFAGINIQGFSGGFIKGTIERPGMVFIFISIFYVYNYFMFYLILRKETELHNFTGNSIQAFAQAIVKYIVKKEIGKFMEQAFSGPDHGYEPRNFSFIGTGEENKLKGQFKLDPETLNMHKDEIKAIPGFEIDTHTINVIYTINDDDKAYYKENKNLLRQALMHEFMDYIFPKYFGIIALLAIIYQCINII